MLRGLSVTSESLAVIDASVEPIPALDKGEDGAASNDCDGGFGDHFSGVDGDDDDDDVDDDDDEVGFELTWVDEGIGSNVGGGGILSTIPPNIHLAMADAEVDDDEGCASRGLLAIALVGCCCMGRGS
ncbi:hypothetical protein HDU67_006301 [Dinochytrium kinnereticum]|nr:hypothetical protein HDU67_006301 [Dinochytrium kinnereticum]